jgi:hypothetical protein
MKQSRILRISSPNASHYKVQKKGWFFWGDITYWDCWWDMSFIRIFKTLEEAEEYIKSEKRPIKTIVKTICQDE